MRDSPAGRPKHTGSPLSGLGRERLKDEATSRSLPSMRRLPVRGGPRLRSFGRSSPLIVKTTDANVVIHHDA